MPRTLFEKLWDAHVVREAAGEPALLYIDLHLVHEVTSPQAFDGLRAAGRRVRRPDLTVATVDHNVPTTDRRLPVADPIAAQQMETLRATAASSASSSTTWARPSRASSTSSGRNSGLTRPGMTIVCGDSHTSTHGAFGALAFGIGTSEVEHVLATQCLPQSKPRTMLVNASTARCPRASRRRISRSGSSDRLGRTARPATSSNTPAQPSARSRWKVA